jgi:DNA polymerase V
LREAEDDWIRRHLTIVGLRTVHELRGIVCHPINPQPPPRKLVSVSRSFGAATENLSDVRAAVATFTAKAAEKLRRENLLAGKLTVWLETDRFRPVAQYANSTTLGVAPLSQCTMELSHLAWRGLERIFQMGYAYRKAGVVLSELEAEAHAPRRLWNDDVHRQELMRTMDALNARWGRDTLRLGLYPTTNEWRTKAEFAAPGYTTRWADVMRCQ